jgi:hypothetical protein
MGLAVNVYGTLIHQPDQPGDTFIDGWDLPVKEQMWRRKELPEFFDRVEVDKEGNVLLADEQLNYARIEVHRCKYGYWCFINGVATYIPGKYYFYLQWWRLEDDIHPEYRDVDRRYYLFLEHWEKVLWCLGVIRGKKRREGASSQATANLVYEAIFYVNSNCGLISKTKDDSKATFIEMVSFGYNQLPIFMKPKQINDPDSVTEIVFGHKSVKAKEGKAATISDDKGHRSKLNYKAPVLNAYDRGRMTRILLDEFGKLEKDVPASQLFAIVAKTLVKGVKRVGFVEMPSTVNKLTKGGGEFKLLWKNANQFQRVNGKTINRLVRYFSYAYDGYEGFIDKYGASVIDAPTEEQFKYLVEKWVVRDPHTGEVISEISEDDIRLGAKAYLLRRRQGLEGDLLEEEIRMNPCNEEELFMAAYEGKVLNAQNINARIKELTEQPVIKRKIVFYKDLQQNVLWRDTDERDKIYWDVTPEFELNVKDAIKYEGKLRVPKREHYGAISIDSYSNSQGGRKYGSKAAALIGYRHLLKPVGLLYGRPKEKGELHTQVLLAAEYCGFKAYYEHTADDYYTYFKDRGMIRFLGKYPLSLIDPTTIKKAGAKGPERHYGTPITPFSLTKQLDNGIAYFEHHCNLIDYNEILEWGLEFEPSDRTECDIIVSLLILISVLMEPIIKPKPKKESPIRTFSNPNYGKKAA